MAITFFAEVVIPADSSSATNTATQNTITPPPNMKVGDLCFVLMQQRGTATMSNGITGGQVWFKGINNGNGSTISSQYFWCRYNGTWAANPRFDFSSGTCTSIVMLVFRPTDTSKYWSVEFEASIGTFTAGSTPFTKTISGVTTNKSSSVAIAAWLTADDNTWGSLSGTGWSKTGLTSQYRNTSGSDQSMTLAYNVITSTGSIANVSQNQATLGGDAGLTYLIIFNERGNDFLGYPTLGPSSSSFSGEMVGCRQGVAVGNSNSAIVDFYATSTSGPNTMYLSLYKVNGANYEFLTSTSVAFNSGGWYKAIMNWPILNGVEYWVGMTPNNVSSTFNYSYFPGIYDNFAFVQSLTYTSGVPNWPSTISVASPSGGYFPSNCSVSLRFSNSLMGAYSDIVSDVYSNLSTFMIGNGNLGGAQSFMFADSFTSLLGKARLQMNSEIGSDSSSSIIGRVAIPAISNVVSETLSDIKNKITLQAIGDQYSDSFSNNVNMAFLNLLSEVSSISISNARFTAPIQLKSDSFSEGSSVFNFKAQLSIIGNTFSEALASYISKANLSGFSETYSEGINNIGYKAHLEAISDCLSDSVTSARMVLLLYGSSDTIIESLSGIALNNNLSLNGISQSWNEAYCNMRFRSAIPVISESFVDTLITIGNFNDTFAGELRKCVGGILVLADLPAIYNNKNITGNKLYVVKNGELKEIKTLSS